MGINETYFNPFNPGMDYNPMPNNTTGQTTSFANNLVNYTPNEPIPIVSGGTAPEVDDVIHLSKKVKTTLDNRYPKGWRIVDIGRSPSLVVETLKEMGVDAKSCPISGLTIGEYDFTKRYPWLKQLDTNDVRAYGEYLKEIGISGEEIARSSKTTVFVDYTITGNSLRGFSELIGRSEIGIKQNADFLSLNNHLIPNPTQAERNMIERLWEKQGMKAYSFMPRLHVAQLGKVKQVMAEFKPPEYAVKFLQQVAKALKFIK